MELHEALRQVETIQRAAARTEVFRGYRSGTAALSSLLAVLGAIVQQTWIPRPLANVDAYLYLWCGIALFSVVVSGTELWLRARCLASPWATRQSWFVVEQFLPPLVAGALVTLAIAEHALDVAWLLPAWWSILFSLSLFASLRFLPKELAIVALHYLVCGVLYVMWAGDDHLLSPWMMGGTFGFGQALAAILLYIKLERNDGETDEE